VKKCFFFILYVILISVTALPQTRISSYSQNTNSIKIDIELSSLNYNVLTNSSNDKIISFINYSNESRPGDFALPSRELIIALPSYTRVNVNVTPLESFKIKGIPERNPEAYLKNDSTIGYNNNFNLPKNSAIKPLFEIRGYLWIKNYYCVDIRLNQYRFNNSDIIEELQKAGISIALLNPNSTKILKSQSVKGLSKEDLSKVIINFKDAVQLDRSFYESQKLNTNDSWIDFNSEYLKIGTGNDGIYRITKSDLDNLGIQTSTIVPSTFRLISEGVEIPVYVFGENDGQFDSGDYVEFVGKRNWGDNYRETSGPGEHYKEYLNRYSDTTIYWLTWGGINGERVDTTSLVTGLSPDTLDFHYEVAHYEKNQFLDYSINSIVDRQDPEWLANETWVWAQQGVGTVNRGFTIQDPYPGKIARAFYKVQDYASNISTGAHRIGLSINSDPTVYDSSLFNKYDQRVVKAEFSSNLLVNGNNILKTISFPTNATLNSVEYDWYEVEYPRYNKTTNDSLYMNVLNDVSKNWTTVKVTNAVSADFVIYRASPYLKKILNYNKSGTTLYFRDSVSVGNKYIATSAARVLTPTYYYKKTFTDLSSPSNQADYILITAPEFLNKANEYVQFISQNYNVTTKVIKVGDIYDQYSFGFFAPEPIRTFLQAANLNWQAPKPSYLFIVGDANYDYYGNTHKYFGSPIAPNYVPSYGDPVSDSWFVIWDSTSFIPQMKVGRIPSNSITDFDWYFDKHKKYLSDPYDLFNKTYMLISSGDPAVPSELQLLKNTNNYVADNIIEPAPTGGLVNHLYKTTNPTTNFGPYTEEQIKQFIDTGGLFISYIGHSGTQIWDNGINSIEQLKNNNNKSPLISDWGCSTGKFAEPDIKAFSELFINNPDGQAIGYTGNSSLGFTSTATSFPKLFYSEILQNNASSIGEAHNLAKMQLLSTYGYSEVYKVFDLCNVLLGDPIVKLNAPVKPNLVINNSDLIISLENIDDSKDSVMIKFNYYNYGRVDTNDFVIRVIDQLDNDEIINKTFSKSLPTFKDSILFYLPTKNLAGNHKISVELDDGAQIDELSESDNSIQYNLFVQSSSVRVLVETESNLRSNGSFILINPVKSPPVDSILIEYADNPDFNNPLFFTKKLDTLITPISFANLINGKRYWFKIKLNSVTQKYGGVVSFIYDSQNYSNYFVNDSLSFSSIDGENLDIRDSLHLLKTIKDLKVQTAGYYDGTYALVFVNGVDYVNSSNVGGHHLLVFDEKTLAFEYEVLLNYYANTQVFEANYIAAIDSIPNNKIIVIATNDDAAGGVNTNVKNKLKSIGSTKIDSVTFRSTWAIITKKNYTPGHVLEGLTKPFGGPVVLDTLITLQQSSGSAITENIGPAGKWNDMNINSQIPANSSITADVIGIKTNGVIDTLFTTNLGNNLISLSQVNAHIYPFIKLKFYFNSEDTTALPSINSVEVNYDGVPELGINYQLVTTDKDSVIEGKSLKLNYSFLNVGETAADSFYVKVDVVNQDNSKSEISNVLIPNVEPGERKDFSLNYTTNPNTGSKSFLISIDPNNKITEIFKDNNFYNVPFFVKDDTNKPALNITFNGREIVDNDYVSSKPEIKIELNDPSFIAITDTSAITIKLNNDPIYYAQNQSVLTYKFNSANPKMVVNYKPQLEDGNYSLSITGRNNAGNQANNLTKDFSVSSEPKIIELYNYPNPFSSDTYFTFKLTQIPDELKIKIFTVAGRLIKYFNLNPAKLNYDFNRIHWDGRDQDGDLIANGVYLYKAIMTIGGKTQTLTQKLAVMR